MRNNNEKQSRWQKRYEENTISVYLPKEIKQQLLFVCKLRKMPISTLCRKILELYLNKKNIEKIMLEYALKHILPQNE